jgi:hypothetical protein
MCGVVPSRAAGSGTGAGGRTPYRRRRRRRPEASLQALLGLTLVRLDRRDDVQAALGCCLTSDGREGAVFDAVFEPC